MPKSEKPPKMNQKAVDEMRGDGDHFTQLFDQDEDAAGQKIDEATGRPIMNSPKVTGNDEIETKEGFEPDGTSEDVLGKIPEENDDAAKWLREHGGE